MNYRYTRQAAWRRQWLRQLRRVQVRDGWTTHDCLCNVRLHTHNTKTYLHMIAMSVHTNVVSRTSS